MAWRLKPVSGAQRDESPTKKYRAAAKPKSLVKNMATIAEVLPVMDVLVRSQLQSQQRLRAVEAAIYTSIMIDLDAEVSIGMINTGHENSQRCKGKKNHGLGPPHIHVWMAMLKAARRGPVLQRLSYRHLEDTLGCHDSRSAERDRSDGHGHSVGAHQGLQDKEVLLECSTLLASVMWS